MKKIVILCENSIESMLTAIYDGFVIKNERFAGVKKNLPEYQNNIEIRPLENYEYEMFAEYITVKTDEEKAEKTVYAIRKKLGEKVWHTTLRAICHFDNNRGTQVFHFLVRGFRMGSKVIDMLYDTYVISVMELSRKTANEAHYFVQFIRFEEMNHILYSRIEPKCNVLPLIAEHFSERFPNEDFIIYDVVKKLSVVHKKYEKCFFVRDSEITLSESDNIKNELAEESNDYGMLWKTYFDSIAIEQRKNRNCQRNMLPLWYRKNMIEFSEENS
ncbi:TIGR03915 family putative DNA repair protein [Lachnospiraceae bacterium 48-33]